MISVTATTESAELSQCWSTNTSAQHRITLSQTEARKPSNQAQHGMDKK